MGEDAFADALERSARRAFGHHQPGSDELESFLESLHLADLALACACATGRDDAWEYLVQTYRPGLYKAADSLDPSGRARDDADALWADLFGVKNPSRARPSLFLSFHGRSSLATWLRAVLAQRHIDRIRAHARERALPEDEASEDVRSVDAAADADTNRSHDLALVGEGLARAIAALPARDRLRLGCYYGQGLTLAEIGRLTGEHEATVSRHLARTRDAIRTAIEAFLGDEAGFDTARVAECIANVVADPGSIDLADVLDDRAGRKKAPPGRSIREGTL